MNFESYRFTFFTPPKEPQLYFTGSEAEGYHLTKPEKYNCIRFPAAITRVQPLRRFCVVTCADGSLWKLISLAHGRLVKKRMVWSERNYRRANGIWKFITKDLPSAIG